MVGGDFVIGCVLEVLVCDIGCVNAVLTEGRMVGRTFSGKLRVNNLWIFVPVVYAHPHLTYLVNSDRIVSEQFY